MALEEKLGNHKDRVIHLLATLSVFQGCVCSTVQTFQCGPKWWSDCPTISIPGAVLKIVKNVKFKLETG